MTFYETFKQYRNRCANSFKFLKVNYYCNKINENRSDNRQLWKCLSEVIETKHKSDNILSTTKPRTGPTI